MLIKLSHLIISLLAFSFTQSSVAKSMLDYDSIWKCDKTKRNWYCDEVEKPKVVQKQVFDKKPEIKESNLNKSRSQTAEKQEIESAKAKKRPLKNLNEIKDAQELREELKYREDIAIMNPTEENVKNYLDAWHLVQNKATEFTNEWRRVVWTNPQYDYSLVSPSNNAALQVSNESRQTNMEQYLKNISKEHGLVFFFRSDCPYCHQFAPILQQLSIQFGIEVLPVTIDGQCMSYFSQCKDGRLTAQQWGVDRVPATFIVSKRTKETAPIGFGVMSYQEVIERIWVLTNPNSKREY